MALARVDGVDGFIVEHHSAGGHNAPPRGWQASEEKPLAYGVKDVADISRIAKLGKTVLVGWWSMFGGVAATSPQASGAQGIQVGTPFAFCRESGMENELRQRVLAAVQADAVSTYDDGRASPTGFPFKNGGDGRYCRWRNQQRRDAEKHAVLVTCEKASAGLMVALVGVVPLNPCSFIRPKMAIRPIHLADVACVRASWRPLMRVPNDMMAVVNCHCSPPAI